MRFIKCFSGCLGCATIIANSAFSFNLIVFLTWTNSNACFYDFFEIVLVYYQLLVIKIVVTVFVVFVIWPGSGHSEKVVDVSLDLLTKYIAIKPM